MLRVRLTSLAHSFDGPTVDLFPRLHPTSRFFRRTSRPSKHQGNTGCMSQDLVVHFRFISMMVLPQTSHERSRSAYIPNAAVGKSKCCLLAMNPPFVIPLQRIFRPWHMKW